MQADEGAGGPEKGGEVFGDSVGKTGEKDSHYNRYFYQRRKIR